MNYYFAKDLLNLGFKIKKFSWDNKFIKKDNRGLKLVSDGKLSKFIPSICDMESIDWTIKY